MVLLRLLSALFKLAVVSMLTGAALSAFDVTAADLLARIGMTPEAMLALLQRGVDWAIPNIVLGSMIVAPAWLIVYLLRPPSA